MLTYNYDIYFYNYRSINRLNLYYYYYYYYFSTTDTATTTAAAAAAAALPPPPPPPPPPSYSPLFASEGAMWRPQRQL